MRIPGSPDTHTHRDSDSDVGTEVDPGRDGPAGLDLAAIRRLDALVATLPPSRFRQALVPACGTGELAWRLAGRCGHVTAFDESPTAIALMRSAADR